MAYTKTNWINDSVPAINAGNLNKIEQGIYDNSVAIEENTNNIGDIDNLTTKNNSNVVEAINEVNNKFNYSTEEQVIGKWRDGKSLYRKTITFTTTIKANETTSIAHNIKNAKNIFIDFSASFMEANIGESNYISYSFPLVGYGGNITDKVYCYANLTNIEFYANGNWATNWTKHITLKYTKTTD